MRGPHNGKNSTMRTIALALIGAGLAVAVTAAAPIPAKAESDPTIQNNGGTSYPQYWPQQDYRRYGHSRHRYYAAPGYAYTPGSTWNGCPPHFTVQDGVCKPYRGY